MMLCEWLLIFKDSQPPDMGSILQVQGDLLMDDVIFVCQIILLLNPAEENKKFWLWIMTNLMKNPSQL